MFFWKRKTECDFGDLYDLEEFEGNWQDTYQYYRSVFTLEFIHHLQKRKLGLAKDLLAVNDQRQFLIVDGYGEDEITALRMASYWGYEDIVEKLLTIGANPNLKDEYENTAVMLASYRGHNTIVTSLLDAKADPNFKDVKGKTALMKAAREGHEEIVENLLNNNADPNVQDIFGYTALIKASR